MSFSLGFRGFLQVSSLKLMVYSSLGFSGWDRGGRTAEIEKKGRDWRMEEMVWRQWEPLRFDIH